MSKATRTLKFLVFVLNILWALLGIVAILFAGFGWGAMPKYFAIAIAVLGGLIMIISFLGCCGIFRESPRLMWIYGVLLSIILLLTVTFICFNEKHIFSAYAIEDMLRFWKEEKNGSIGAMDNIQQTYKCCALHDYVEYETELSRRLPSSCCRDRNCLNPLNIYEEGCFYAMRREFTDEAKITQYAQWGLLSVECVILVFSSLLAIQYTNRERRSSY